MTDDAKAKVERWAAEATAEDGCKRTVRRCDCYEGWVVVLGESVPMPAGGLFSTPPTPPTGKRGWLAHHRESQGDTT